MVPVTIHLLARCAGAAHQRAHGRDRAHRRDAICKSRFGIARPRLAVAGLNPHAGEDGSLGHEEQTVVAPAVEALRADGIDARGPLPADTMFHAAARSTYDCAVCMYHDQALIPIKTVAFDDAVNVTLGLPFIRTSPDHGTAFDIAGTGRANPASLIAALKLARGMAGCAEADERDRRPPAASRGHSPARTVGTQIAGPELPARPQSHRAHRACRRAARGLHHH